MARTGQFSGGTTGYGAALSYVHPRNNDFDKLRYAPELAGMDLTRAQRERLQERIDELYLTLRGERDFF